MKILYLTPSLRNTNKRHAQKPDESFKPVANLVSQYPVSIHKSIQLQPANTVLITQGCIGTGRIIHIIRSTQIKRANNFIKRMNNSLKYHRYFRLTKNQRHFNTTHQPENLTNINFAATVQFNMIEKGNTFQRQFIGRKSLELSRKENETVIYNNGIKETDISPLLRIYYWSRKNIANF